MVESSDSILPYSYAPLAPSNNSNVVTGAEKLTRRRSLKTGLLVFSALLISALIMSSVDFNTELNVTKNETKKVDDLALRPAPQNLAGIETVPGSNELLFKVTRGKPNGVSEKANGFPMRGLSLPVFDWNDLQLSWQRTAFHFQPQKNWMNGKNEFLIFFFNCFLKFRIICELYP